MAIQPPPIESPLWFDEKDKGKVRAPVWVLWLQSLGGRDAETSLVRGTAEGAVTATAKNQKDLDALNTLVNELTAKVAGLSKSMDTLNNETIPAMSARLGGMNNSSFTVPTNRTGSRSLNTAYQNTSGKPILVRVAISVSTSGTNPANGYMSISPDNSTWMYSDAYGVSGTAGLSGFMKLESIVPDGYYVKVNGDSASILGWVDWAQS